MVSWALSVTKGLQENMLCTCHVYRHVMSHLFASQTEKWCCKNDIAVEKHEMGSMESIAIHTLAQSQGLCIALTFASACCIARSRGGSFRMLSSTEFT